MQILFQCDDQIENQVKSLYSEWLYIEINKVLTCEMQMERFVSSYAIWDFFFFRTSQVEIKINKEIWFIWCNASSEKQVIYTQMD